MRKVAFISSHPDDVELCCGILMRRLISSGVKVYYFCVTDGAPSSEILSISKIKNLPNDYNQSTYKTIRRKETIKALSIIGVNSANTKFLDWPDLECYKHISGIVQDFNNILHNIDGIFCCPFEGGHPDHDITRFAIAAFLTQINYSGHIFEYASYNNRGYQVFQKNPPRSLTIRVKPWERKIKQKIAEVFVSQKEEVKLFKTNMECFRQSNIESTLNKYTIYKTTPYYEQFAYSNVLVLKRIKSYLRSTGNFNIPKKNE